MSFLWASHTTFLKTGRIKCVLCHKDVLRVAKQRFLDRNIHNSTFVLVIKTNIGRLIGDLRLVVFQDKPSGIPSLLSSSAHDAPSTSAVTSTAHGSLALNTITNSPKKSVRPSSVKGLRKIPAPSKPRFSPDLSKSKAAVEGTAYRDRLKRSQEQVNECKQSWVLCMRPGCECYCWQHWSQSARSSKPGSDSTSVLTVVPDRSPVSSTARQLMCTMLRLPQRAGVHHAQTAPESWCAPCSDCPRELVCTMLRLPQRAGVHHAQTAPESWCAPCSDCPWQLVCTMLRLPQRAGVHHAQTAPDSWCAPCSDCPRELVCTMPRLPQTAGVHHAKTAPDSWCAPRSDCPRELVCTMPRLPQTAGVHHAKTAPDSWCAPRSDCPRELVCTMPRLPQTAGVHHAKTAPDSWLFTVNTDQSWHCLTGQWLVQQLVLILFSVSTDHSQDCFTGQWQVR